MDDKNTEVQQGLEDAIADEKPETSHGKTEETQASGDKGTDKSKPGPVPYSRFKEVNDKASRVDELEAALNKKNTELEERSNALTKLTTVLEAKERDAGYVQAIRDLYRSGDEKWAPVLEKLEKKLAGVEEEVETGDKTEKQGVDETRKILKQTTDKLQDAILDQRAELIVAKADAAAAEMLNQLPEEYTENDKRRISHYLSEAVNWEEVENAQNWQKALEVELGRAFEHVLNKIYGEPEGVISQRLQEELKAKGQVKDPEPTPQERLDKIANREWGKFTVEKTATGKLKAFNPEASDEEFSRAMADAMKAGNEAARAAKAK